MQSAFLAQKGKTSQQFDEKLRRIPVTTLLTPNTYLMDVKSDAKHGYNALKLTIGVAKHIDKPTAGQLKKVNIDTKPKAVKELRIKGNTSDRLSIVEVDGKGAIQSGETQVLVGEKISPIALFKVGDFVDVTGVSKGKGFQGGVKRHGFHGGPKTHGQSDRWRAPGSVGATTTPGRTFKGQRMAGRMGSDRVTVQHLQVIAVADESVTVKGLIPGIPGTLLEIRLSV
jgi:large subunit ribosomal protein L3